MARVVRRRGGRFRPARLSKQSPTSNARASPATVSTRMFDATSDDADTKAFAARCEEDRHHFGFTMLPEDAGQMPDLRALTRELMTDAESDLGARLE
jgi:type IV secretory pathway VirD2 relaxase